MLKAIVNFLKALNSNRNPSEVAHAFCMGVILGFMPKDNALWFLVFVFFLFVRINKPCYLIVTAVVSLFAWACDPVFNSIGYSVLTFPKFENFFSWLLDLPFVNFTKFNNTIVMGSLVSGLVLYIPLFVLIVLFVKLWRKMIAPRFADSVIMKAINKLPLVSKIVETASEM